MIPFTITLTFLHKRTQISVGSWPVWFCMLYNIKCHIKGAFYCLKILFAWFLQLVFIKNGNNVHLWFMYVSHVYQCIGNCIDDQAKIAKTIWLTSIRHQSDTSVLDRYLIGVNLRAFAILDKLCINPCHPEFIFRKLYICLLYHFSIL